MVIHSSKQTILCLVEIVDSKQKFFCSFVYAANTGKERKHLWKELGRCKSFIKDKPWVLMGDWNVILNIEDHSEGGSCKSNDMIDFQECIDNIEVEDLNCSGIYFTCVQSRQDPSIRILKKIDRVLGNVDFMSQYTNSHAIYLPHLSSDHSPAILVIPEKTKSNAFRFSNFITDKPEFLSTMQDKWNIQVAQRRIDKDPHNANLKKQEAKILKEYSTAKKDEEKLLVQKAKIDWLCEGDKIHPSKSVTIGRQITDNILLMQELLKGYNRKNGARRVALKIDIQIAYDTVNWDFLEASLQMFHFPNKMIEWIMVCIRTVAFTININNENFKGGRRLRQGDLISPYIFTLMMEVFSLVFMQQIKDDGKCKYHWGCKDLKISHLCFAYDLLVLCYGDHKYVQVIKRAMETFSSISGLHPNIGKSIIFFGNVHDHVKQAILSILPFKVGSLPVLYLGVPLITKQLSFTDCKCLIDKVKTKVNNWINRMLSYVGRL
nr:RNA-directed DNA polymerase, eukaryota, reverse transcriptase zinc-binding domain protein [Tanacetum cinerariifolium]